MAEDVCVHRRHLLPRSVVAWGCMSWMVCGDAGVLRGPVVRRTTSSSSVMVGCPDSPSTCASGTCADSSTIHNRQLLARAVSHADFTALSAFESLTRCTYMSVGALCRCALVCSGGPLPFGINEWQTLRRTRGWPMTTTSKPADTAPARPEQLRQDQPRRSPLGGGHPCWWPGCCWCCCAPGCSR